MLNNMSYILFINLNSISTGYVPQNPGRQGLLGAPPSDTDCVIMYESMEQLIEQDTPSSWSRGW
jgi:hypothetical protein